MLIILKIVMINNNNNVNNLTEKLVVNDKMLNLTK